LKTFLELPIEISASSRSLSVSECDFFQSTAKAFALFFVPVSRMFLPYFSGSIGLERLRTYLFSSFFSACKVKSKPPSYTHDICPVSSLSSY